MIVVWSHSSADSSVADTTYFGIALSRSAIGPVWSRHARAKPCQVSRGSSSASAASARWSAPCRPASLMYGKSASAGEASMTPSSVACVCAVIELMRVRPSAAAQLIAAHETGARRDLTRGRARGARTTSRSGTGSSSQCHERDCRFSCEVETNVVALLVPACVVHEQGDLDAVVDVELVE